MATVIRRGNVELSFVFQYYVEPLSFVTPMTYTRHQPPQDPAWCIMQVSGDNENGSVAIYAPIISLTERALIIASFQWGGGGYCCKLSEYGYRSILKCLITVPGARESSRNHTPSQLEKAFDATSPTVPRCRKAPAERSANCTTNRSYSRRIVSLHGLGVKWRPTRWLAE